MTPIPPTDPSFAGLRFALFSQVSAVDDAALARIVQGCALLMADVCKDYRLAPIGLRIISSASALASSEILATFAADIGDPSAAAYHEQLASGLPAIFIGAGPMTAPADWENDTAHEIAETIGDADVSTYKLELRADGTTRFHAFELCDRTQGISRPLDIGQGDPFNAPNILLSAYWTQQPPAGARLDTQGAATAPFELLDNSYGVYVLGTGGQQQEASGSLAAARIAALAPIERVITQGTPPARKLVNPDGRYLRRVRDAHRFAKSL